MQCLKQLKTYILLNQQSTSAFLARLWRSRYKYRAFDVFISGAGFYIRIIALLFPKAALIYLLSFPSNYWIRVLVLMLRIYNHVLLWNDGNTSIFKFMQLLLCIKSGSWWLIETKNHISVVMNSCGKWLITACFMYTNFPWKYFDHFGHYELLWSDI